MSVIDVVSSGALPMYGGNYDAPTGGGGASGEAYILSLLPLICSSESEEETKNASTNRERNNRR